jgi:hypothetical protein
MVHGPSTTAPAYEGDASATEGRKVHFFPRILVSAYDDAWLVAIEEQEWLLDRLLFEQPAPGFISFTRVGAGEGRTSPRTRG